MSTGSDSIGCHAQNTGRYASFDISREKEKRVGSCREAEADLHLTIHSVTPPTVYSFLHGILIYPIGSFCFCFQSFDYSRAGLWHCTVDSANADRVPFPEKSSIPFSRKKSNRNVLFIRKTLQLTSKSFQIRRVRRERGPIDDERIRYGHGNILVSSMTHKLHFSHFSYLLKSLDQQA